MPKATKVDIERVRELFRKSKKSLWFSDVCKKLDMDLEVAVTACQALAKEGVICVDKKALKK